MMSGINHMSAQGVPSGIRSSQLLPDQQQQQYLRQQQMLRVSRAGAAPLTPTPKRFSVYPIEFSLIYFTEPPRLGISVAGCSTE